jgi:hypothetical protein
MNVIAVAMGVQDVAVVKEQVQRIVPGDLANRLVERVKSFFLRQRATR